MGGFQDGDINEKFACRQQPAGDEHSIQDKSLVQKSRITAGSMGARINFSRGGGGQNHRLFKKVDTFSARRAKNRPFFVAPKAQTKIFAIFRDVLD